MKNIALFKGPVKEKCEIALFMRHMYHESDKTMSFAEITGPSGDRWL
jgi:hypothetical protein